MRSVASDSCKPTAMASCKFLIGQMENFLGATRFLNEVTWAKGIDASGRPILAGKVPAPDGTRICPGIDGATN